MGRKPKPTPLKLIEGNKGKRALNNKEPQFGGAFGPAPKVLGERARELWFECGKQLEDVGLGGRAFAPLLMMLCQTLSDVEQCIEIQGAMKDNYEPGKQGWTKHPVINDTDRCMSRAIKILSEFGMTPAAASKIVAPSQADDDPLSAMGL